MTSGELEQALAKHFPYIDKPKGNELSFHEKGSIKCEYLRSDLEQYERELDEKGT